MALDYHETWNAVRHYRWNRFVVLPTTHVVIPLVLEFHANLKLAKDDRVYLRRKWIDIAPERICEHYGVPFYRRNDIQNMDTDAV